jgi:DNA mismatch repair protein MutL
VAIRILDDALVDQIAAGEVVERPASAVKELVENSLDAGASQIRVRLEDGGKRLIRVQDDGSGMDRQDAVMCLERHATSKIRSLSDLVSVGTLGFRGEAVPSIASVSRFEVLTRRAQDEVGTRVVVEGGVVQKVEDAGCAPGTQITARDLFFNIPVRKSFLRTAATELGHVLDVVQREAMWRPDVDFLVTHDGRDVLRAPAAPDPAARARALLGEIATKLRPVSFSDRGVQVDGLAGPAGIDDASGRAVHLLVNGRYVRDPVLRKAVRDAYDGVLAPGRTPVVVLHVRLASERVDVNAHPAKIEVRFRDPRDVAEVVSQGLREALHRASDRPTAPPPARSTPTLPLPGLSAHPGDDPRFRVEAPRTAYSTSPGEPATKPGMPAPVIPPVPRIETATAEVRPPEPVRTAAVTPEPARVTPGPRPAVLAVVEGRYALLHRAGQVTVLDVRAARARRAADLLRAGGAGARLLVPRRTLVGAAVAARLLAWEEAFDAAGLSLAAGAPTEIILRRAPDGLLGVPWEDAWPRVAACLAGEPVPQLPDTAILVLAKAWEGPATAEEARDLVRGGEELGEDERPLRGDDLRGLFA